MKKRIAIAIALSALVAGCSSTEDYVDDVNEIQSRVIDASNSVGTDVNASRGEIEKSLAEARAEAEAAVADLKEVDVPSDAEAGHEELVEGFEDLEMLFAEVREKLDSGASGGAFSELRTQGAKIDKDIDSALDQINEELGLE